MTGRESSADHSPNTLTGAPSRVGHKEPLYLILSFDGPQTPCSPQMLESSFQGTLGL